MKRFFRVSYWLIALAILLSVLFFALDKRDEPVEFLQAKIIHVVDGDTMDFVVLSENEKFSSFQVGQEYRLRLIGIDAPESVHPDASKNSELGELASVYASDTLLDKEVTIEFDTSLYDRYGRVLGYIWTDSAVDKSTLFNEKIVEDGWAILDTVPPNVKYADRFASAMEKARNNDVGIWTEY